MNQSKNDEAVYRTAQATQGLLNKNNTLAQLRFASILAHSSANFVLPLPNNTTPQPIS